MDFKIRSLVISKNHVQYTLWFFFIENDKGKNLGVIVIV